MEKEYNFLFSRNFYITIAIIVASFLLYEIIKKVLNKFISKVKNDTRIDNRKRTYLRLFNNILKYIVLKMKKYKYEDYDYYGQMSCLDDGPIMFSKEGFKDTVLLDFEDTQFRAMNGYEEVLHQLYGDYMQMPPEDKRTPKQYWIHYFWKNNK